MASAAAAAASSATERGGEPIRGFTKAAKERRPSSDPLRTMMMFHPRWDSAYVVRNWALVTATPAPSTRLGVKSAVTVRVGWTGTVTPSVDDGNG